MTARARTPRDHDAAIRALRAKALEQAKVADEGFHPTEANDHIRQTFRHNAAAYSLAADYLASIVGKSEQAAGKRPRRRRSK